MTLQCIEGNNLGNNAKRRVDGLFGIIPKY